MKAQALRIDITRKEGPVELCDVAHVFEGEDCWQEASDWLRMQSHTFPRSGYDKHDFTITFANGLKVSGTLDCKHFTCPDNDLNLAAHVYVRVAGMGGNIPPSHVDAETYARYIEVVRRRNPERIHNMQEIWATCEIPA